MRPGPEFTLGGADLRDGFGGWVAGNWNPSAWDPGGDRSGGWVDRTGNWNPPEWDAGGQNWKGDSPT